MPNYRPSLSGNFANLTLSNLSAGNALNTSINMNGNGVVNMANPANAQDAATKNYVDTAVAASGANTSLSNLVAPVQPNQNLDMQNSQTMINVPLPVNLNDVATKNYVDNFSPLVGASKQLDNLLPTSINESLVPSGALNLGSAASGWDTLYASTIRKPTSALTLFIRTTDGEATSGSIAIYTGANPGAGSTGFVQIITGDHAAGSTGAIFLSTGAASAGSGSIQLATGSGGGTSGTISIQTGGADQTLGVTISSGSATVSNSGSHQINTGSAPNGSSGGINITTGDSLNLSGIIRIETGGASNAVGGGILLITGTTADPNSSSGDIELQTGTPGVSGTKGKVLMGNGTIFRLANLSADPATGQSGDMYFNTVTSKFRGYDGLSWVDLN